MILKDTLQEKIDAGESISDLHERFLTPDGYRLAHEWVVVVDGVMVRAFWEIAPGQPDTLPPEIETETV